MLPVGRTASLMTDELETHEISLGGGLVFSYHGPQDVARVYFGTVGDDPDFNNELEAGRLSPANALSKSIEATFSIRA